MEKEFGLGAIVGRFQIIHKGHARVIEEGIARCEEFAIFVGSSQEEDTAKNPFSYEERKAFLELAFPKAKVYPLADIGIGNVNGWGDYVVKTVIECCGRKPEVFFSGEEERRVSWVSPKHGIKEIFVPKEIVISSSQMKDYILEDDREMWNEYIVPALRPKYDEIRRKIIKTKDILETKSI